MEYYEMRVFCQNCHKTNSLQIEKGVEKEDVIDETECPTCGVIGRLEFS